MSSKVLIIDDEKIQASFYELALRRKGYEVEQSRDVDAALIKAAEWQPDVIILDIMMPPGKRYAQKEHFDGLRTGIFLIPDLLAALPGVLIVVSTVVRNPDTLNKVRSLLPPQQVTLKAQCDPQELANLVEGLIRSERQHHG